MHVSSINQSDTVQVRAASRVEMEFANILCFVVCLANVVYTSTDSSVGQWTDGKGSLVRLVLHQNSEAELICPTNIATSNITFLKDGERFTRRPLGKINKVKNGIKLPGVLAEYDNGNYTCTVQNNHTNMSRTFVLNILICSKCPTPGFILVPENKTVNIGDNTQLVCRETSCEPHITWLKHYMVNGSYVDRNNIPYTTVLKSGTLDTERLTLHNVSVTDTGWYTCVVSLPACRAIQRSAWIEVLMEESVNGARSDNHPLLVVIMIALGVCAAAAAVVIIAICWQRHRPPKSRPLVLKENSLYFQLLDLPIDQQWELDRSQLQIGELLGEGAFGKVYKGYVRGNDNCIEPTVVAIKMLKDGASETELADLLREMEIMKSIGQHINIINLLGCCTRNDGPVLVIVEYAPHENLRDYLRQRMPLNILHPTSHQSLLHNEQQLTLTYRNLVSFAYQVARGMEYLASKKIVHRDLAARNVLVGSQSVMKIADFGLTRDVEQKGYYRRTTDGRVPVKWMAPESLCDNQYTTKSDVWSYGILLWEIFSYGSNPYPSVRVEDLFQLLRQGYRMERPFHATDDIYETMQCCWRYCPHERPEFVDIVRRLDRMVSESVGVNYLCLESLPDANQDGENEVFTRNAAVETDSSLLVEAVTPHGSDSQYASLTSSEPPSSPERYVNSSLQDSIV